MVLKAVYRGVLNQSNLTAVFRDMTDNPDYKKADEIYFRQLLEAVTKHVEVIGQNMAYFMDSFFDFYCIIIQMNCSR